MSERNDETKELLIFNVKRYRKAQHLTQEKLAEMSGLNSIADIEGGRSNPNLSTIVKLANSLKVEVWQLFFNAEKFDLKELSYESKRQLIKDLVDSI